MNTRHEVEWTPPPALDTGQNRINYYHQPERLLRPPENPEPLTNNNTATDPEPPRNADNTQPDDPLPDSEAESSTPRPVDDPGEPGGPAPPENQAA
jgi:hypothetical protein